MDFSKYKRTEYDTPYYEDNTRISNSSIGWFLNRGPSYFSKVLSGEIKQDPPTSAMRKGTAIHAAILQPDEFLKNYVTIKNYPISTQQKSFCKALAKTLEIEPNKAILSAYKEAYSIIGKNDEKMLSEGLKIASEYNDYIEAIKENKIALSISQMGKIVDILSKIKDHIGAKQVLEDEGEYEDHIVFHEFQINWDYHGLLCKSLLDSITFFPEEKVACIMDVKTTSHIWNFEDSVKTFDYGRQMAFYQMAVEWYLNKIGEDAKNWLITVHILAVSTEKLSEVRVFHVDEDLLSERLKIAKNALLDIKYLREVGFEHSPGYYKFNGIEHLKCFSANDDIRKNDSSSNS